MCSWFGFNNNKSIKTWTTAIDDDTSWLSIQVKWMAGESDGGLCVVESNLKYRWFTQKYLTGRVGTNKL